MDNQGEFTERLRTGHPIGDYDEEFGDNMHHLFFSGNIEPSVRGTILARFNQEKEKLFPQGRGL